MTTTTTHVRVHTFITFANPYLICAVCRQHVERFHDPDKCGCDTTRAALDPCGHSTAAIDLCPSRSPVDGCRCSDVLPGREPHEGQP